MEKEKLIEWLDEVIEADRALREARKNVMPKSIGGWDKVAIKEGGFFPPYDEKLIIPISNGIQELAEAVGITPYVALRSSRTLVIWFIYKGYQFEQVQFID